MVSGREASRVVDGIFREEVLILGALLAVHDVPRAFSEQFLLSLERVRRRAYRRLRCAAPEHDRAPRPGRVDRDPAIQRFLDEMDADLQADGSSATGGQE